MNASRNHASPADPIVPPAHEPPAWLEIAGGVLFGIVAMASLQSVTQWPSDNDSFYHLRMARLLPEIGFPGAFPWLAWTIFNDNFVSHHYGFHVLLFPFVWVSEFLTGDLILGGKAMTAVCMGATPGLFVAILRELRAPHRGLWLLMLACVPWEFWLRLSYIRAPIVALPLLLAATLLLLRGRALLVGVVALLFTHVYAGVVVFPIAPAAFVGGALAVIVLRKLRRRSADAASSTATPPALRTYTAATVWTVIAIALGLVVSPYFPENLPFLRTQIFQTGLAAPDEVGGEWKPYSPLLLAACSVGIFASWAYAIARRRSLRLPLDVQTLSLLFMNLALLTLTLKSRRFVEYWPIFSLLSAVAWAGPARELGAPSRFAQRWPRLMHVLWEYLLPAAAACAAVTTLAFTRARLVFNMDFAAIRDAARFVAANSASNELILTDDWDTFPVCFYFNTHNYYAVGLDPVFTSSRYPGLWERYKLITRGQTPASLPETLVDDGPPFATLSDIAGRFHAEYVLVLQDHDALYRQLESAPTMFTLVYPAERPANQPPAAVFRVIHP